MKYSSYQEQCFIGDASREVTAKWTPIKWLPQCIIKFDTRIDTKMCMKNIEEFDFILILASLS